MKRRAAAFFASAGTMLAGGVSGYRIGQAPVGFTQAAQSVFLASADYQLNAYALAHQHTVVTYERSEPSSRKRVKIPDACVAAGVLCTDPFTMMRSETVRLGL